MIQVMEKDEMIRKEGLCLECGERYEYGRAGQRFCSDKCRNDYHNRQTRNGRNIRLRVVNALNKNYTVLQHLLKSGLRSAGLADLMTIGFNPEYCTSYHRRGIRQEYRCYDIKYYMSETKLFSIEKIQLLMSSSSDNPKDSLNLHCKDKRKYEHRQDE